MKNVIDFERDIERYLKSKLPDIPEHTVMEIATYMSDRAALFIIDGFPEDIKKLVSYTRSPKTSYKRYAKTAKCEVDEICFETRKEAYETVVALNDIISSYGFVSVADLYDLVGKTAKYYHNHFGWVKPFDHKLVIFESVDLGWRIVLPKPVEVD